MDNIMEIKFDDFEKFLRPFFEKEYEYSFKGFPFGEKPNFSDFCLGLGFLIYVDFGSSFKKFSVNTKKLSDLVQVNEKFCYDDEEFHDEYLKLERDIFDNLNNYIDDLSNCVKEVFKFFNFDKTITFLNKTNSLFSIIEKICPRYDESFKDNETLESVSNYYNQFVEGYFNSEVYGEDYYNEFGVIPYYNSKRDNDFLRKLLFNDVNFKNKNKISIYDPACVDGNLLLNCKKFINKINPDCDVHLFGSEGHARFFALCLSKMIFENQNPHNFIFFDVDCTNKYKEDFLKGNGVFDFIISDMGIVESLRSQRFRKIYSTDEIFFDLEQKFKNKLVINTSIKNMDDSWSFFTYSVLENLLDTIMTLPVSSRFNRNSIIILNKIKDSNRKNKFFLIDEYSEDLTAEVMSNRKYKNLLKNYNKFEDFEFGCVFSNSDLGKNIFNFNNFMYDKNIGYNEDNIFKLSEIANIFYDNGNYNCDLLIKENDLKSNEKIVFYPHEVDLTKNEYISCILTSDEVLKDYLYHFLNSNKGINDLMYFKRFNNKLFKNIEFLRVPIPDINTQKKVINASSKLNDFFNKMDIWKNDFSNNILDYRPALESYKQFSCDLKYHNTEDFSKNCSNWRIVYQGLAWPLAYNYLKATKGSNDVGIKQKNYLRFFEFLTSFNVIVLISGIKNSDISDEDYDKIITSLWRKGKNKNGEFYNYPKSNWHEMHFGGWTTLYRKLVEIYKESDFSLQFNRNFLDTLAKEEYFNLFDMLRNRRNKDSHSAILDDIDEQLKLEKLQRYMDSDILEILNIYSGLKLYYTTTKKEDISDLDEEHDVYILNGPCYPYFKNTVEVEGRLKSKRLYLYNPIKNKFLEIDSDLMKFDEKTRQLYIFNSFDSDNQKVHYMCYQKEINDFKVKLSRNEDPLLSISNEFKQNVLRL